MAAAGVRIVAAVLLLAGAAPAWAQDANAGKAIYERKCLLCHGEKGDGKGPSAELLLPKPRDFTRGLYKIRSTVNKTPTDQDLFRIITEGMPGTSMPAWAVLPEKDRHNLVAYIKSFAPEVFKEAPKKLELPKEVSSSEASIKRGKEMFDAIECHKCHGTEGRGDGPSRPELKDEWGHPVAPANLTRRWTFRGGRARTEIATRLANGVLGTPVPAFLEAGEKGDGKATFPDAIALQFAPQQPPGTERPYFLMGDATDGVYLLRWEQGKGVTEVSAHGPTKLAPIPGGEAAGKAVFKNGQYALVMKRPLAAAGAERPTFRPGVFTPVAFQAWDGGAGETGPKMSLTSWYYLRLEEPQSNRKFVIPPVVALLTFAVLGMIVRAARSRAIQ